MTRITNIVAAALLALSANTTMAHADASSGRSYTTGTVAGGGSIGGPVSNGSAGGERGGNATSRRQDYDAHRHRGRYYHNGRTYNHRIWSHGRWYYS